MFSDIRCWNTKIITANGYWVRFAQSLELKQGVSLSDNPFTKPWPNMQMWNLMLGWRMCQKWMVNKTSATSILSANRHQFGNKVLLLKTTWLHFIVNTVWEKWMKKLWSEWPVNWVILNLSKSSKRTLTLMVLMSRTPLRKKSKIMMMTFWWWRISIWDRKLGRKREGNS